MSPTKPDLSEERKEQILQAAMKVFNRRGFSDARMDDIVEESGMSKGGVYWYFKSKEEIIIAILDLIFGRDFQQLEQLPQAEGTAQERLQYFIEHSLAEVAAMMKFMPITFEFYAMSFRHETVQKVIKHYLHFYLSVIEPIIEQGIASGEFRDVNVNQSYLLLILFIFKY